MQRCQIGLTVLKQVTKPSTATQHGIVLIEASSMQTADPFLKATTMRLDGLTASLDLRMQLINVSLTDTNSYPTQWRTEHKFPQVR